jgi:hypothetical protein
MISIFTLLLLGGVIFSGARPTQSKAMALDVPNVAITFPANGSSMRAIAFTGIRGTFTVPPGCRNVRVKVSLGKQESDEEWAQDSGGTYKWVTGPTGQWLPTGASAGRWSAPTAAYRLPSGANLPVGSYVIYAYAEGEAIPQTSDQCKSKQERIAFKITGR